MLRVVGPTFRVVVVEGRFGVDFGVVLDTLDGIHLDLQVCEGVDQVLQVAGDLCAQRTRRRPSERGWQRRTRRPILSHQ